MQWSALCKYFWQMTAPPCEPGYMASQEISSYYSDQIIWFLLSKSEIKALHWSDWSILKEGLHWQLFTLLYSFVMLKYLSLPSKINKKTDKAFDLVVPLRRIRIDLGNTRYFTKSNLLFNYNANNLSHFIFSWRYVFPMYFKNKVHHGCECIQLSLIPG